ncbi:syntaphilin [Cololabis saira]|uniref:syntaphilin n=1 Tax=Cololabis saira TaxID=129043 RepID=UPI002AD55D71|nr:syntaphilin [Cololabis saira]
MSLTPSRKSSSSHRRRSVGTSGVSGRYSHSDTASTQTYPGRMRAPEGSPRARTYPGTPGTPRFQLKHTACSDNHGIRPPTPEQYLTPLQQKEVSIRHLRARLRENVERLQHRDCEIEELRTQLYKMQEDWIEEECHRVEAQLALKEARKEIHHLQEVVESVRSNLGVREQDKHDHKPYPGLQGARPAGKSRSCGCSPASTLTRGASCTRQSSEALQVERASISASTSTAPELGGAPRPAGQAPLLLEAALLSEPLPRQACHLRGPPAVARSSTYERLCSGGAVLPVSHSCHTLSSSCKCSGHPYVPHHHLFLHLPQEEPPVPPCSGPAAHTNPVRVPAPERRPEVRSQACSPTMSWLCEEGGAESLSVISLAPGDITPSDPQLFPPSLPLLSPPERSLSLEPLLPDRPQVRLEPLTRQPQPARLLPVQPNNTGEAAGAEEGGDSPERCHWSRYFLVDLLALAVPVVPTVAWLCRGVPQEVMPVYHIGSLLRGCCAVALHSLRRQGAGRGCRRSSVDGTTTI